MNAPAAPDPELLAALAKAVNEIGPDVKELEPTPELEELAERTVSAGRDMSVALLTARHDEEAIERVLVSYVSDTPGPEIAGVLSATICSLVEIVHTYAHVAELHGGEEGPKLDGLLEHLGRRQAERDAQ